MTLVGRLTKDCDLRYTSSGVAVAAFTLAVNRNFTNQNGEREADYIQCVIWRKPAETLANYTRKGTLVGLVGRLQTRNYENQQGQRIYVTEVVVESFQLLESKEVSQQRGVNASNPTPVGQQESNTQQPFPDWGTWNIETKMHGRKANECSINSTNHSLSLFYIWLVERDHFLWQSLQLELLALTCLPPLYKLIAFVDLSNQ